MTTILIIFSIKLASNGKVWMIKHSFDKFIDQKLLLLLTDYRVL